MSARDDSGTVVLWLLAAYVLSEVGNVVPKVRRAAKKAVKDATAPIQQGGAALYDLVHNDAGHKQDLPGQQMTKQAVLAIAAKVGFPDPKLASAIAFAESGGVPGAIVRSSREYSVGLWQINTQVHPYTVDDMKDPIKNASAAFQISKGGTNWSRWTGYTSGKYRSFMTGALAP